MTPHQTSLNPAQLLMMYPCFEGIPEQDIATCLSQSRCMVFYPKDIIVRQDESVDAIYLILSGSAEVSINASSRFRKRFSIPVAELSAGDTVGLNDAGLYSPSGKRTATVTCTRCMHVIKIELKQLETLLHRYPQHQDNLDITKRFLKLKLIKEALPFISVPHERLLQFTDKIQDQLIKPNDILFHEGDKGQECYLIVDGEISIFREKNGRCTELATLKPPTVFGEATMITNESRNASAKAVTQCRLLSIHKNHLIHLFENPRHIQETFMTLMINRSRPLRSSDVEEYVQKNKDSSTSTILKQVKQECYFKLSEEGIFIWNQLNGENTLRDITIQYCRKFKTFSPQTVTTLISKLARSGFVQNLNFPSQESLPKSGLKNWIKRIPKLIHQKKSFNHVDAWISNEYQKIKFMYQRPVAYSFLFFSILGFFIFSRHTQHMVQLFDEGKINLFYLLALAPLGLFTTTMHELSHAFSVKHCNRAIHYIGLALNWGIPTTFVDTSDMWLADKKSRSIVNLSGVFTDSIFAAIGACLMMLTPSQDMQGLLWLFCLMTYVGIFKNLSPLGDTDGYFILVDWLDRPKLKESSILWLWRWFKKTHRSRHIRSPECIYWMLSIAFLCGVVFITLFVQNFILKLLNLPESNLFFVLIIPLFTMAATAYTAFKNTKSK